MSWTIFMAITWLLFSGVVFIFDREKGQPFILLGIICSTIWTVTI